MALLSFSGFVRLCEQGKLSPPALVAELLEVEQPTPQADGLTPPSLEARHDGDELVVHVSGREHALWTDRKFCERRNCGGLSSIARWFTESASGGRFHRRHEMGSVDRGREFILGTFEERIKEGVGVLLSVASHRPPIIAVQGGRCGGHQW